MKGAHAMAEGCIECTDSQKGGDQLCFGELEGFTAGNWELEGYREFLN